MDINTILNTCRIDTGLMNLAYYSHLVPIFFIALLATLIFLKADRNIFSKTFLAFSFVFSLWLIGDLITWVSEDYYLIYASWSLLVYVEIVFYVIGFYFATVFVRKNDVPLITKSLFFLATLLPFFMTITQKSVEGFNHPACEAFNNGFLDEYKLYLEILIVAVIFVYTLFPFFEKKILHNKKSYFTMLGSLFLFLSVFGITEYLASATGNYEINLYALFVIPVFLIAMTYSIFSLDVFNVKLVSTYVLVFGFLILTASQLFFVTDSTNRLLTVLTLALSLVFSLLLLKNLHKESKQRIYIAKLNTELQDLIKQRENLVHLVTHKVKGSFTRSKYIFAGILDGTFGDVNEEVKKRAEQGLESDNMGIETVDLVLNVANMQKGIVKYDMKTFDLKELVEKTISDKKVSAEAKGLKLETEISDDVYNVLGDVFWLKEVLNNLVENSIKYTKEGKITVGLKKDDKKILFYVKDTGVGVTEEDKKNLFTEGGRGKDSVKVNVDSTGYGLYSVKLIVEAHKGKVWMEPNKDGPGSTFFVELDGI